jgi:biopolymer transport protein ExbB
MMNIFLMIQADNLAAGTQAMGPEPTGISLKFIDLALKGGWIMLPILALSFIGVYIFIDRYQAIKTCREVRYRNDG